MAFVVGGKHFGQYTYEHWFDDEYKDANGNPLIESFCGLKCTECEFKTENTCKGCAVSGGNPFHGTCELADCAISKKKNFCGECEQFPCEILKKHSFDGKYGDNGARIENCRKIGSANNANEQELDNH